MTVATVFLFANNATTTLAADISSGATSATLAPGTGALFPTPAAGQWFSMTFTDAATGMLTEIVYVTARSGDSITISRAKEGTTAQAWAAGDAASNFWTAGQARAFTQPSTLQQQPGNWALDAGSSTAYVLNLDPVPATLTDGLSVRFLTLNANTGAATLNVGPGAKPLHTSQNAALAADDIKAAMMVYATYVLSLDAFLISALVPSQVGPIFGLGIGPGLKEDGGDLTVDIDGLPLDINPTISDLVMTWDTATSALKSTTLGDLVDLAAYGDTIQSDAFYLGMM